jgi:hypothetical protein
MKEQGKNWLFIFLSVPILVVSYLVAIEVKENLNCRSVKNEKSISNEKVLSLEEKAREEWNSFPLFNSGGIVGRDPTPNSGGQIFSNFEEYFQSYYSSKVQDEKEIGYLLVLNHPQCFPLREVLEIQAILNG